MFTMETELKPLVTEQLLERIKSCKTVGNGRIVVEISDLESILSQLKYYKEKVFNSYKFQTTPPPLPIESIRYMERMRLLEDRLKLISEVESGKFDDLARLRAGR